MRDEILREISLQLDDTLPVIVKNVAQENADEIYARVHLLKPSIGIIKNEVMLNLLKEVEYSALNNKPELKEKGLEFIEQLKQLNVYLKKLLKDS